MQMFHFRKNKRTWEPDRLPRHIAIIMDGNGRWAQKRMLPRVAGHAVGAETFRSIATYCRNIGIEYLTIYAFSTENWKRAEEEVGTIMQLLEKYITEAIETMETNRVKMKFFGDVSALQPALRELIEKTESMSEEFSGAQMNICINYGGRDEILRAAEGYAKDLLGGKAEMKLSEESFSRYMYSSGIPDPDLIIRPGGEMRISNFLLWQSAYSEMYYTDVLWPDFNERELDRALLSYQNRKRRYGGA